MFCLVHCMDGEWEWLGRLKPDEKVATIRNVYPKHEEFMAKICELDADSLTLALKRLSFLAQTKGYLFLRKEKVG